MKNPRFTLVCYLLTKECLLVCSDAIFKKFQNQRTRKYILNEYTVYLPNAYEYIGF